MRSTGGLRPRRRSNLTRQRGEGLTEYIIIIAIVAFCGIVLYFNQLVSAGEILVKWSGCIICDEEERAHTEEDHQRHTPAEDPFRDDDRAGEGDGHDDHDGGEERRPAEEPEDEPVQVANNWNWNGINNTGWGFWWDGIFGGLWSLFV